MQASSSFGLSSLSNLSRVLHVLDSLKAVNLDLPSFLNFLSHGDSTCTANLRVASARTRLLNSTFLEHILQDWYRSSKQEGRGQLQRLAIQWVGAKVEEELESLNVYLRTEAILPEEELLATSFTELDKVCSLRMPCFHSLLQTLVGVHSDPAPSTRFPRSHMIVMMIPIMIAYHRSPKNNRFQQLLSIYWVASGVPSKPIALLHNVGLAMSATWVRKAIGHLSKAAIAKVCEWVAEKPFAAMYDNINIGMKVSSQRLDNHNHFESGTAMTILPFPAEFRDVWLNAAWRGIRDDWTRASDKPTLTWGQWHNSMQQSTQIARDFFIYHIQQFLLTNPLLSEVSERIGESRFLNAPPPIDLLPCGPSGQTKQWLLPTVPIDESTHDGTSAVIAKLLQVVGLDSPRHQRELATTRTVPWVGDQKTVSLIRHLRRFRGCDLNGFDRMDWVIVLKGWFHEQMALQNQIFWVHRGTSAGSGLDRDIKLLARVGLAPKTRQQKPDFHHLHELVMHALEAHIVDCWLEVAEVDSVEELANEAKTWSAHHVKRLSEQIYDQYVESQGDPVPTSTSLPTSSQDVDVAYTNARLFIRDALIYWELAQAVKQGDVGRMGNLIPILLPMFIGGGNPLYAIELLEEMHLETNELTAEQIHVLRHFCWLANTKGHRNSFFPMDQLQEHNIRSIKHVYRPAGPNASWEFLERLSPIIPLLTATSFHVEHIFGTGNKGRRHEEVGHGKDVSLLVKTYHSERLHRWVPSRKSAETVHTDVLRVGCEGLAKGKNLSDWKDNREKYLHSKVQKFNHSGTNDPTVTVANNEEGEEVEGGDANSDDWLWGPDDEDGGEIESIGGHSDPL